jgi:hypothetical protein
MQRKSSYHVFGSRERTVYFISIIESDQECYCSRRKNFKIILSNMYIISWTRHEFLRALWKLTIMHQDKYFDNNNYLIEYKKWPCYNPQMHKTVWMIF